jgi:HD superfamily phosphodiesterase
MDEQKAIEMGKVWMKKSTNPGHDFEHAENVEKHALEIWKSLCEMGWCEEDEIDETLIVLCVWWHDCYKALLKKRSLLSEFVEGVKSAQIVEKELSGLVSAARLKKVSDAIKVHNNVLFFLLSGKKLPLLSRILIEADTLDAKTISRKKRLQFPRQSFPHRIVVLLADPILSMLQRIYIKSPYARKCLSI